MLSHELRNPLAAILSATRLLENAIVADHVRQEAGLVVERQAKHMARLLDDLLDVARITRGRIVLRNERIDLRDTTRSAIEALGPFLAEHDSHLDVRHRRASRYRSSAIPRGSSRCRRIFSAMRQSIRRPAVGSRLEVKLDGQDAMIRVADNGHGIEPEMLPRIFDLFVQGDKSLDRSESGLGIGLTLLRSLVELHNGRVEAHSDGPDRGSVFTVWLPLAPAASEDAGDTRQVVTGRREDGGPRRRSA